MPVSCSAADAAVVQLDKPFSLHPDKVFEAVDDRDRGHAKQIWDLRCLSDQSVCSMSAFQRIQSLRAKAGLDAPITLLVNEKLISRRIIGYSG